MNIEGFVEGRTYRADAIYLRPGAAGQPPDFTGARHSNRQVRLIGAWLYVEPLSEQDALVVYSAAVVDRIEGLEPVEATPTGEANIAPSVGIKLPHR